MKTVIVNGAVTCPSKIVCIGRNYAAHIEELGNEIPDSMVVFNKPNCAIGDTLYAELADQALHYEGELAFIVKNGTLDAVGFGLDLTKRALQSNLKQQGLPWERAKAFNGAALFSKFTTIPGDVSELSLQLHVNGKLRQSGGVSLMMYKPADILLELNTFTTLEDGDIIMTGTPQGVGEIQLGERFEGQVLWSDTPLIGASWTAATAPRN